jgi:ankyrin repeat protein
MREDYAYENEWGLRGLSMLRKNQRTRNRQSPRHRPSIKIVQQESQTFLHLTTLGRHEALVSMLIKKGLDVNAKGRDGETALLQAAKIGHVAIAQLLRGRR